MKEMKEIQEIIQSYSMVHLNKCPVCVGENIMPWHRIDGWILKECSCCGFVFLDPRPDRSYYKNLYDPLS
jgi:Zn ribbon nucleic-acid-binding protein